MQTAGPSGPVVCILSATSKNAARMGGVLYSISVNGGPTAPQPPCRGRRPRRPAAAVSADPTAFHRPPPGRGMVSRYIMRHMARSPPAVGVGVLDDPSLRSPPAPRCHAGCGRRGPPAKGEPPARVPPLTPSCASLSMGVFRALRRAARAPPLDPARFFVKKRGKKLLLG